MPYSTLIMYFQHNEMQQLAEKYQKSNATKAIDNTISTAFYWDTKAKTNNLRL